MRREGKLKHWDDDKGFGFIKLGLAEPDLFVHISAFPRRGIKPQIDEPLSFEIHIDPDGRRKAINIQRPTLKPTAAKQLSPSRFTLSTLLSFLLLLTLSFFAYQRYQHQLELEGGRLKILDPIEKPRAPPKKIKATAHIAAQAYSCDGRQYCSQMTSCAEAYYFLTHCPNVKMDDKDNDGVPCEQQWCH